MKPSYEKIAPGHDRSFRCFERIEPSYPFNWHYHGEHELTLIAASRGRRVVGDHMDEYAPGDMVLIGSNLPHTWASHEPAGASPPAMHRAVVAQFTGDMLGRPFEAVPELAPIARMLGLAQRGLHFPLRPFADVVARMRRLPSLDPGARLIELLSILHQLAGRCDEAHRLATARYSPTLNAASQTRIDRVCRHIHDHLGDELTQAELAAMVGMNPAAFSRFFKRTTGRTVTDYINELRIASACRMLTESDLPVLDVCYRSGFANVSNFNRRFKEIRRLTPRQFRRRFGAG